jgi:hypothetical protein
MYNYLEFKQEIENFYENEFRLLKLEIENDIKVEIIDNSKFGDIGGRFNFLNQIIYVNSQQSNEIMFLTLLHEYGHFLTFRDYIHRHNICPYEYGKNILKRELGAYYHGWKYIKSNSIKVSKKIWKEHHIQILKDYDVI